MITPETEAVITHMTPAEARAFAKLMRDAENEGVAWAEDALAMAIWAVAVARLRGYRMPAVVEPMEVMAKCL